MVLKGNNNGHKTAVEYVNGAYYFTIDGEVMNIPVFETYSPKNYYFNQFSQTGTRVFSFNANPGACDYGHSSPTCPAENTYDYTQLDMRVDEVIRDNPDAMIIPRVMIGTPKWWLEKYPEELMILDNGSTEYTDGNFLHTLPKNRPFPSLASEKWRRDTAEGLRKLISHIQSSKYADRIFGYFITGLHTEEWYHWSSGYNQLSDYSETSRQDFISWLIRKYKNVESLRKAWNDESITFEEVKIPSRLKRMDGGSSMFRNPLKKMDVIDYYLYYNELIPDTIDYFAEVVKKETQHSKVVGAFYAYMYEFFGDPEYGHNALSKYNQSKYLDFVFVTASYEDRKMGSGGDYMRSPSMSVSLNKKLWYHDNDTASFRSMESMRRCGMSEKEVQHYADVLGAAKNVEETVWMYRRSAGFCLANGMFESFFDLHGGYFDHPELMEEIGRLNKTFERAVSYDRSSAAEVLIVSDEASCSYCTFRNPVLKKAMRDMQNSLIKIGTPSDHVLTCDLDKIDISCYKVVIALNLFNVDTNTRNLLDSFKKDGRTIIWNYAPGYFNGTESGDLLMKQLCNIDLHYTAEKTDAMFVCDGYMNNSSFGIGDKIFDKVCVEEKNTDIIAFHAEDMTPAVVKCDFGTWKSVYAMNLCVPPSFLRSLLSQSGVHIYNDRDDTFYLNASYMTVHADGEGERKIKMKSKCDIYDEMSQRVVAKASDCFRVNMMHGETLIFRYN